MDKASRAIKRSGAKLLSLGGSHGDLSVLLAGLKEIKNTTKSLIDTQSVAAQDLVKWASKQENKAIQDVVSHIGELQLIWVEQHKMLLDHLKDYRNMFEMILQGEKKVAQAKENMEYCDQKEIKARKELRKATKREPSSALRILESRVAMAEDSKNLAQIEVSDCVRENECVKLIRLKEGLLKMTSAYVDFGSKCTLLYAGQREIAEQMPDVHGRDLENIRYTGARTVRTIVQETTSRLQGLGESYYPHANDDPPPPYVPPGPESQYQQPLTTSSNSPGVGNPGDQSQRRLSQPPLYSEESPSTTMQITNVVRIKRESCSSESSLSRSSSTNLCECVGLRSSSPSLEGDVGVSGSRGSLQGSHSSLQEDNNKRASKGSDDGRSVSLPDVDDGRPMPMPRRKGTQGSEGPNHHDNGS